MIARTNFFYSLGHYFIGKLCLGHIKISKYCPWKIFTMKKYPVDIISWGTLLNPTTREIERAAENDIELSAIRECLVHQQWNRIEFKEYLPIRGELCSIGKLVLRGSRIVIPKEMRNRILEIAHEGHPGIVAMKSRLRTKVW